ncbi:MAG: ZIP family metal transporter, partial [Candidatus Magasanikbacteria bacterium]|nr:ZIP family metal transporter [Candidatus Magasanikbacteria bacterium]
MEITLLYSLLAALSIGLVSLIGVTILSFNINVIKSLVYFLVAFAAGALLGDIFFHLFPELVEGGFDMTTSLGILGGIISMFILEKII